MRIEGHKTGQRADDPSDASNQRQCVALYYLIALPLLGFVVEAIGNLKPADECRCNTGNDCAAKRWRCPGWLFHDRQRWRMLEFSGVQEKAPPDQSGARGVLCWQYGVAQPQRQGMSEHAVQQRILLACGSGDVRLWRNNVGTGWAGPSTRVTAGNLGAIARGLRPGDVVIRNGRPLHAGLCVGSSDLIGYHSMVVGPEQVGQRLAVFAAVEVKSATGRPSKEQQQFLNHISTVGGKAGIARSVEDAQALLGGHS